ncbi:MAG: proprotein convertase P-domain-containing protein [Flavobacteriales bacterium]|nr:proprotein convertase P-domain-containing protein [Flavobacteriales bacterium]
MKNHYQKVLSIGLTFVFVASISAQNKVASYWTKSSKTAVTNVAKVNRNAQPTTSQIFNLDLNAFKTVLVGAPIRGQFTGKSSIIVAFPTVDGKMENYRVMESPIMEASLAANLPSIKTYVAQGIDDPTAYMRFSVTSFGLHTMSLSGYRSTTYIDPYTTDLSTYIIYDRNGLGADPQPFECLTDQGELPSLKQRGLDGVEAIDDQKFRTFRLAQTCTAEYGNIFATTPGNEFNDIMTQINITVNRVNSVYEIDLGITLQLIANQSALVFWGSTSADPWSGEYNTTTQNFLNSTLANGDYDIGHNFNTSGGGNAGCIGCVCVNGQKGSGMTGRANPTGDPFDIDYVAHEMGHQFGGYHTMNTCSRSGSGQTEVEPASGSSIMGYAGICATDVQPNSDAHFNYVNVRDISANIKPGGTSTCAAVLNTTNNPPTANAGNDYTIPKSTAFILEGTATDADGMVSLTYEWSQNDPAQAPGNAAPQSTWTTGPLYRAKMPIASPNRYMPTLPDVIVGNLTPTWEVTPSVGRTMNFSFMVRDNEINGAQTADDLMQVTVAGSAGPFTVTSQTSAITWNEGTTEVITWNVANTTAAPVSTPNVDIFLSLDGGLTYPTTLATGVANNGTANILVPTGSATTTARIMVRGSGNIFYALNSTNFSIVASEFVMNFLPAATTSDVCAPGSATYNFTYNTFLGFSQTTTFSASGNPAGTTVSFSPTTAQNNGTAVTMTINGITAAMVGNYAITVTGTAPAPLVVKNSAVTLNVYSATFNAMALTTPANGATGVIGPYNFNWVADANAATYNIDIATDAAFTNIIENATGLVTNNYTATTLSSNTMYYWRVMPANQCGNGNFSTPFDFTTSNCNTLVSTDLGQTTNVASFTSILNVTLTGVINNVTVNDLMISHPWVGDLSATLTSPQGTTIQLFDGPGIPASTYGCDGDDLNASFDDAASLTSTDFENMCNNSPAINGSFQPMAAFSAFNGESPFGNWTLTVFDSYTSGDDGTLDGWGLDLCLDPIATSITHNSFSNSISIYPNPTSGFFNIDLGDYDGSINYTITTIDGRIVKQNRNVTDNNIIINLSNHSKGMYLIRIDDINSSNVYKIIKE